MAIAAYAPVLPNQKKECCKIARFTDAPFILAACIRRIIIGAIYEIRAL